VAQLLIGIVSIPLALFISHLSSLVFDIPWGVQAAAALAAIGYGLFLTSQPMRRHVWSGLARRYPLDIALATILITGLLTGAGVWFLIKQEEARLRRNFVSNGSFESGTDAWTAAKSSGADSRWTLDTTDRHSGGAAFRFDYSSEKADDQWAALLQRITRLRPRTEYAATFWALVEQAEPKPLFLTTDPQSANRTYVENKAGWREYRLVFNTGDSNQVDLRFVIEAAGTVWVDDVALQELKRERPQK
jgi:Carbohydrate binding domain